MRWRAITTMAALAGTVLVAADRPAKPKPRKVRMVVRAYCPCRRCCGRWAKVPMVRRTTATGAKLYPLIRDGVGFVAAPRWLPAGTWISVPGYHRGRPVQVLGRGGAVQGNRLEVFIANHEAAEVWGVQTITVTIYPKGHWCTTRRSG